MNYQGVIIEESLENKDILQSVHILETQVKQVTEKHKTPWIKQWTMYKVEISENTVDSVVLKLKDSLDSQHSWYVDFKNDDFHYIIFRNKFFKIDRSKKEQYDNAVKFGISLGIPDYQLDFSPHIKELESKIDASIKYLANILVDGFLDQFKKDHPEASDNICFSKDEKLSRKKKH